MRKSLGLFLLLILLFSAWQFAVRGPEPRVDGSEVQSKSLLKNVSALSTHQEASQSSSAPAFASPPVSTEEFNPSKLDQVDTEYRGKLSHYLDLNSVPQRLALFGFLIARRAQVDGGNKGQQEDFLKYLKDHPLEAKNMVAEALSALPVTADFAIERAGLISVLDLYVPHELGGQDLIEKELLSFSPSERPALNAAMSESEKNLALSSGFDHEYLKIAFAAWLNRTRDFEGSIATFSQVMSNTQDYLLRREYYAQFTKHFAQSDQISTINQALAGKNLPLDQIENH